MTQLTITDKLGNLNHDTDSFQKLEYLKVLRVCQGNFDLSSTFDVSNKDDILKTLGNMGVDVFHIRPPSSLFTKRSNEKMMAMIEDTSNCLQNNLILIKDD